MCEVRKKRILIVTQYFWPEEFRVNELVRKLTNAEYEVDVLTGQPNYPDGSVYDDYINAPDTYRSYFGADIYRVKNKPRGNTKVSLFFNYLSFSILASIYIFRFLKDKNYDSILAVQLSPIFSVIPALLYGKFRKIRVTTWVMDLWPDILIALSLVKNRLLLKALTFIATRIYRASDSLLISSEGFRSRLLEMGVNQDSIHYFPQWVEEVMVSKNLPLTNEYKEVKKVIEEFKDRKKIVFTGNIGECQDLKAVMHAIKLIKHREDFVLLIVGSGREQKNVSDLILENGLKSHVRLLGRYPASYMPSFYHFADALLLPLANEPLFEITLPGKTQSYLYAARPIIGFLGGEGASVLRRSKAGFICPDGDVKELAAVLECFCDSPQETLDSMGRAGRRYAEQNFSSSQVMDTLFNVCHLR